MSPGKDLAPLGQARSNTVDLIAVRMGTHLYDVRYAYYDGEGGSRAPGDDGIRKEASRSVEAWSAADAVVQIAIYVDNLYRSSRCKILEVKPGER